MKLTKYMLVILGVGLVMSAHGGISEKKKVVNGCRIVIIKSGGIICPSTTTLCFYRTNTPGELLPLNSASNPGVLGSVAGAAGTATSGALIRPSRTSVNQGANAAAEGGKGGDSFSASEGGDSAVTVGKGKDGNNGNGGNPHFN